MLLSIPGADLAMGSVLEGAATLIIFGPLLIPNAVRLGIDPLHFGVVLVVAMEAVACSHTPAGVRACMNYPASFEAWYAD